MKHTKKHRIWDTIIVGAGAAGMAAAIACKNQGQKVLLIDKQSQMGRKILVTGNGKCNLTNFAQKEEYYRSDCPGRAQKVLSVFGQREAMELFQSLGIYTKDKNGYVYPYSEQAASVREAFEAGVLSGTGVTFVPEAEVRTVSEKEGLFYIGVHLLSEENVQHKKEKYYVCKSLLITTGGLAGPKFGCDGSGYTFAKRFGHRIIRPLPALTALKSSAPFLKKVSGVRNQAAITLEINGNAVRHEIGELQWTDYGISGVAIFQLSRFAITALEENKKVSLSFDFMPELPSEEKENLFLSLAQNNKKKSMLSFLKGLFPAKLCPIILREAKVEEGQTTGRMKKQDWENLVKAVAHFSLRINGYASYEKAQVTRGGVSLDELTDTLESVLQPGLFFAGEVADVDGTCGGYNLQWAFSSGTVAGRAIVKRNQELFKDDRAYDGRKRWYFRKEPKKMIRISQLKLKVGHTREELFEEIIHQAHGKRPVSWQIVRKSVDARKKPQLFYVYTIDAEFENEKKLLSAKKSKWTKPSVSNYTFPYSNSKEAGMSFKEEKLEERPVIVGMGPAGLFAALVLARAGFAPVVFERGDCVETRSEVVEHFFETGELDEESNVQFGEGGAGTFSDGKLNTLVKDKFGRNHFVLKEFVKHGAPEDILYEAKPHIGTDILKDVVASIRKEIESLGGEVHFRTKVCDILCEDIAGIKEDEAGKVHEQEITAGRQNSQIKGLLIEKDSVRTKYPCRNVIFAIGHSARDTFYMLHEKKLFMTPKAFAIGVRVEHPAYLINESQYGKEYPEELPTASYKLTHQCESTGRGIYSFCMCPGGYVVNSSSEKGRLCVNGMSYHDRAGRNSNTALITTVTPEDFSSDSPLAGLEFQRKYEKLAYKIGNGKIPVQLFGDFMKKQVSTKIGTVTPSIKGDWQFANLHECLPDYVCESLLEGMKAFGRKIKGYDAEDAVFSGVETRTSSPLRMERNKKFESNIKGFFPCGEGAGYAGGITSAAMDGIKTAEAIAEKILTQN